MKLKAGKTYRMRNGELETLEQVTGRPLLQGTQCRYFYGQEINGNLVFGGRPLNPYDLMEEVEVTSQKSVKPIQRC